MSPDASPDYELSDADENVHHAWDNSLDPVLTVEPGDVVRFECRDAVDGIEVPLDSFPGTIGNAPGEAGEHDTLPPRDVGGNMDVKHLTEGSTVYLPVENEGALFSTGDCHAAQGDGEVCVTGIEVVRGGTAAS
jgi:acetamidase/formamidase